MCVYVYVCVCVRVCVCVSRGGGRESLSSAPSIFLKGGYRPLRQSRQEVVAARGLKLGWLGRSKDRVMGKSVCVCMFILFYFIFIYLFIFFFCGGGGGGGGEKGEEILVNSLTQRPCDQIRKKKKVAIKKKPNKRANKQKNSIGSLSAV